MKEFLTSLAIVAIGFLILVVLFPPRGHAATDPRFCDTIQRNAKGHIQRSSEVIAAFRAEHPCPSTGKTKGPCRGWSIDYVIPLASCGCDAIWNMQWLPTGIKSCAGRYCKVRWERRIYTCPQVWKP